MILTHFGIEEVVPLFQMYALPTTQATEEWSVDRPPIVAQVAGAGGVYDFYGLGKNLDYSSPTDYGTASYYPVSSQTITRSFTLTSSTYSGIEDELDELRRNTIAFSSTTHKESWLYALPRNTSAKRKARAKCINMSRSRAYNDGSYVKMEVELTFFLPEGLWYETYPPSSAFITGTGTVSVSNGGNYPALVTVFIAAGMTNPGVSIDRTSSPAATISSWVWTGVTAGGANLGTSLAVRAASYSCLNNNGTDAYSGLAIGSGQIAWLWLPPTTVANAAGGPATHVATITASAGSARVDLTWYDTYIIA